MFRISLPSNASLNYYPNNIPSNFIVKPAQSFDGVGYECALTEIIFPNRLMNVRPNANTIVIRRMVDKNGESDSIKGTITIPPGYYGTVSKLIETINEAGLKKYTVKADKNEEGGKHITLAYDVNEKRVTVHTYYQYAIQFGSDIARMLGFPLAHNGVWEGLFSNIIEGEKKGDFHATTSAGLNTLYVFTDIIKEQFVGGTRAPLLRIINLTREINNDEYTSKTFDRLYFAPLKSSHFDSINIRIYDDTGELINFEYGKVVVVLEFRKSPNAI